MNSYVLKKSDVSAYLKQLKDTFEIWTPVSKNGRSQFVPYNSFDEIDCRTHTQVSLKSFFLPQCESLFEYSMGPDHKVTEQVFPENQRLIFGVKPCDARAMRLNASFLIHDKTNPSPDLSFESRQKSTVLIGYGCDQPGTACFCHSVGGDPFSLEGLNAIVTDLGRQLLITVAEDTAYAKKLVIKDLMHEATDEDIRLAQQLAETARKMLLSQTHDPKLKPPSGQDIKSLFDLPVWRDTAERCLNCGVCTYVCPTCTCFDIIDHFTGSRGKQLRCWDSCMFGLFTKHASGHNPRPGKKERLRQRFMHKLRYFPERYGGNVSCVGCGRCVMQCPVNIDIREVAKQMVQQGEQSA